ncbi:hypothetical protein [Chromobacterium phragmitis]|uniref:Uncharacterized protein n=1 Tax=Chromobacterium phragmitis TaxID=2202141 RepID=A0A344UEB3_9NEIS|nr:hypothetical protein [Chromobacterium phragmitis]AXE33611.1 hypothetical protein DK843_04315 [Chromobacterium phragmitis]
MLQKLENAYLAILRFVTLLVAGALLIAAVVMAINSLRGGANEPEQAKLEPKVSAEQILQAISPEAPPNKDAAKKEPETADPLAHDYQRTAKAISRFIDKTHPGLGPLDQDSLLGALHSRSEALKKPEHAPAFVKGMADTMEKLFAAPAAAKAVKAQDPFDFINGALDHYTEQFENQADAIEVKNAERIANYQQEQADSAKNLYFAAACFGAFLLIVFQSIIIRIERNLRCLERLPKPAEEEKREGKNLSPAASQA